MVCGLCAMAKARFLYLTSRVQGARFFATALAWQGYVTKHGTISHCLYLGEPTR